MHRPDMRETLLKNRTRLTLFWATIGLILLVAAMAVVTIVRMTGHTPSEEPPLQVFPAEVSLCPGQAQQFSISAQDATWEATGGDVTESGLFTAGATPGDYQVLARDHASDSSAQAVVHVLACSPTPEPVTATQPPPTAVPETSTPEPALQTEDAPGDVLTYDGAIPGEPAPGGVDIRMASIDPDLSLQIEPSAASPSELLTWVQEGELLCWIVTYEPVPADVYPYWVFALDTDADTATGRTPGSARINPDLGDEAALNLYYDSEQGQYVAELAVWSPTQEDWVVTTQPVRYIISESRTVIGMAVPLAGLVEAVAETSNVTAVPAKIRARAGAVAYAGSVSVIDLYPDRPE